MKSIFYGIFEKAIANVHNVSYTNVMNVSIQRIMNIQFINQAILNNSSSLPTLLPHLKRLSEGNVIFEHDFGLDILPCEHGFLTIRGPRQFGKITWLEQQVYKTLKEFGPGTGFYINGDYFGSHQELFLEIRSVITLFNPASPIKRIFIDEITSVQNWEIAIKKLADNGETKDILIITTGSSATDLHRGTERLPGRKGKLKRTNFYFTPISYAAFYEKAHSTLKEKTLAAYIISGGSPIACQELIAHQYIPPYVFEITKEWIEGEIFKSRRDRSSLIAIFQAIYKYGGTPVGQAKLGREAQLSNNTVAQGYIEILKDLGCITPSLCIDQNKSIHFRKPCKYHITNLLSASLYQRSQLCSADDFLNLAPQDQGKWLEWFMAQEILRRKAIAGVNLLEPLKFWQSADHEIDFFDEDIGFIEVKRGKALAQEFGWFPRSFPKDTLLLIADSSYTTHQISAMTLHNFLLQGSSNKS
jgi:predicted AAA+ superfamily ATPase